MLLFRPTQAGAVEILIMITILITGGFVASSTISLETQAAVTWRESREIAIGRKHVLHLLAAIAITCVLVELATTVWSNSINSYGRRVKAEYTEAAGLRSGGEGRQKSVLIVGNSTLHCGVDVRDLRNQIQPDLDAHVLSLDSSMIEDWYFALRELFRKGAHPDFIVLMLPPGHVASLAPPPDDVSYYLLGTQDILMLRRVEGIAPTTLSNIIFARYSIFFGRRNTLRLLVKNRLFPGFQTVARRYMLRNLTPDYRPVPGRFREIKILCSLHGVRLLFVIPPTHQESDTLGTRSVLEAAESAGVPASIPVPNAQLSDDKYTDGYHLNSAGQRIFTAALAEFLRKQAGHDL
jgi:hypothetical protein